MYSVTFSGRSVLYEGARDKITLHLHHNSRQVSHFAFAVTFVFSFRVCVIPLSLGDRVPVAVLLWRGLWPHQRPGLQDPGERETWKVLTTSSLQLIHMDVGVLVFIIIIITTSSLQLIHLDVGDTISLVADELGYSLQYLLFCIHLEAAQY